MVVLYLKVAFEFEFKPFQINIIGSKENRKEKGNRKELLGSLSLPLSFRLAAQPTSSLFSLSHVGRPLAQRSNGILRPLLPPLFADRWGLAVSSFFLLTRRCIHAAVLAPPWPIPALGKTST
jgi:hypothetical protein